VANQEEAEGIFCALLSVAECADRYDQTRNFSCALRTAGLGYPSAIPRFAGAELGAEMPASVPDSTKGVPSKQKGVQTRDVSLFLN